MWTTWTEREGNMYVMLWLIQGVRFPLLLVVVFLSFLTIRLKYFVRPKQKRENYKKCDVVCDCMRSSELRCHCILIDSSCGIPKYL